MGLGQEPLAGKEGAKWVAPQGISIEGHVAFDGGNQDLGLTIKNAKKEKAGLYVFLGRCCERRTGDRGELRTKGT